MQLPLVQSEPVEQAAPRPHGSQAVPPQSTSVSLAFMNPSLQVPAWQMPPLQT